MLAGHFLQKFAAEMNREVRGIAPAAMDQLLAHSWPGNVRELSHAIQRAVALAEGDRITGFAFAPTPASSATSQTEVHADSDGVAIPVGTTLEAATRRLVEATIAHCAGNKLRAARLLGIPPRTMYRHYSGSAK